MKKCVVRDFLETEIGIFWREKKDDLGLGEMEEGEGFNGGEDDGIRLPLCGYER